MRPENVFAPGEGEPVLVAWDVVAVEQEPEGSERNWVVGAEDDKLVFRHFLFPWLRDRRGGRIIPHFLGEEKLSGRLDKLQTSCRFVVTRVS